jgi:predicted DNA-binding protein
MEIIFSLNHHQSEPNSYIIHLCIEVGINNVNNNYTSYNNSERQFRFICSRKVTTRSNQRIDILIVYILFVFIWNHPKRLSSWKTKEGDN